MARTLIEDWEFNVLGIYNYRKPGPLKGYFDFVEENHERIPGDLLEAGVFRGRALIAMALFLKELGSKKTIYGYDTWSGFPEVYHEMDEYERWYMLYKEGRIEKAHFDKVQINLEYRSEALGKRDKSELTVANTSLSGNFSNCSREDVEKRLEFLGLDNAKLLEGPFGSTMTKNASGPERLMAALIDADLYESYKMALPFIWNRMTKGGYMYLDEYYSLKFPGARIATDEFFSDKRDRPQRHKVIEGDFERWFVRRIFE